MFILDTNVLSEMMKPSPATSVAVWIAAQPLASLFTTAVSQAEIFGGIALLAPGRRRSALESAAYAVFEQDLDGRVLPFDAQAALAFAEVFARRRRAGRSNATADMMIAAIAVVQDAVVVTRDVAGFNGCGVRIIDPWECG